MLPSSEIERIKRAAADPFRPLPVSYHGRLPPSLEPWHVYVLQAGIGHRILVCRKGEEGATPIERHLRMIPVKTVLRLGWSVDERGIISCDLPMKRRAAAGDQAGYAELVPDFPLDDIERSLLA